MIVFPTTIVNINNPIIMLIDILKEMSCCPVLVQAQTFSRIKLTDGITTISSLYLLTQKS